MRKSRIQSDGRKTRGSDKLKTQKVEPVATDTNSKEKLVSFIGLSLGGGKADKACVAVVEYYPAHNKIFLTKIYEKVKSDEDYSADSKILDIIKEYKKDLKVVAFDVPFNFPQCALDKKCCGRIESCQRPHVKWMWEYMQKQHKKKKPRKLFTPYTQRAVELYLSSEIEEVFTLNHALGSNVAPLTARAHFLKNHISQKCIEVFPKLSIWRIGSSLQIMKSHLRFHKHVVGGDVSRQEILTALSSHNVVFVYDQDVKMMVENNHAFEAFICALTAVLEFQNKTEDRPKGFPVKEDWISFPKKSLKWS